MAELEYDANLTVDQVIANLRKIETEVDRTSKKIKTDFAKAGQGVDEFATKAGKSTELSGLKIGVVSGIVQELTRRLIDLAQKAAEVFVQITADAIKLGLEFDTTRTRLLGIFDGSQEAADQAFAFIRERSKALGIDLNELAGAFIPKVENLSQFERVAKLATALATSDPEQGAVGARIALIEALSGTLTSLQRRFEIGKGDIERIKEYQKSLGDTEGLLKSLEEILKEQGKDFDTLSQTAQSSINRVNVSFQDLLGTAGEEAIPELKEQFDALFDVLETKGVDFELIAKLLGDLVGKAIEFIGSNFVQELSKVDPQGFIDLYNNILGFLDAVKGLISLIVEVPEDFSVINAVVQTVADTFGFLQQVTTGWIIILGFAQAAMEGITAAAPKLLGVAEALAAVSRAAQGDLAGAARDIASAVEHLQSETTFDPAAGVEAAKNKLEELRKTLEGLREGSEERQAAIDRLIASLKDVEDTDAADTILEYKDALREAAEAEKEAAELAEKLVEIQEEAAEATQDAIAQNQQDVADTALDHQRNLLDIEIEAERKRIDAAIEAAQKREDLARANARAIEDIITKNNQAIADAAKDLAREEEDIARKQARAIEDLERDQAQKRVDIERDYREKLEDIQKDFQRSAEDAERTRDAVAFLASQRRRDQAIQDAGTEREQNIEQTQQEGELRRQELAIQAQRELEDARLTNERKLEDLRINLEQELEAQRLKYERELQDQTIAEQRKSEELERERQRRIEDENRAYEQKLADLQTSLDRELAAIQENEAEKTAAVLEGVDARIAAMAEELAMREELANTGSGGGGGQGGGAPDPTQRGQSPPPRQRGGRVRSRRPYLVGERGPEVLVPDTGGYILSNEALVRGLAASGVKPAGAATGNGPQMMYSPPPAQGATTVDNSQTTKTANVTVDPGSLSPAQQLQVKNMVFEILEDL